MAFSRGKYPSHPDDGPVTDNSLGVVTSTRSPALKVPWAIAEATATNFAFRFVAGPRKNRSGVVSCSVTLPWASTLIWATCALKASGSWLATTAAADSAPAKGHD